MFQPIDPIIIEAFVLNLKTYEITFAITKPKYIRTREVVNASSSQQAQQIIWERYGKENVTIQSVKEKK